MTARGLMQHTHMQSHVTAHGHVQHTHMQSHFANLSIGASFVRHCNNHNVFIVTVHSEAHEVNVRLL